MVLNNIARAAASASTPSVQGGTIFDHSDAKYVQFQFSVDVLQDMLRVLKLMYQNIVDSSENDDIVPLANLIACLCTGWLFNINPSLKKRLSLLLEEKLVKLNTIPAVLNTQLVEYSFVFPNHQGAEPDFDLVVFKKKFYDSNHQMKLLNSLICITENTLQFYEVKLKQIIMERGSSRRPDASGMVPPVDHNSISDFSKAEEGEFSLDLAVLIEDRERDTSDESFRNLQFQVLNRALNTLQQFNESSLKRYTRVLGRYCKSQVLISQLPQWQFTFHKIYSVLLRCLKNNTFMAELMRQLYYPNFKYFNDDRTKLCSENIIEYENLLERITDTGDVEYMEAMVKEYCKNNTILLFQTGTLINFYTKYIVAFKECIAYRLSLVKLWIKNWEYLDQNVKENNQLYKNITDDNQITTLLQERRVNDRLTCNEPLLQFIPKTEVSAAKPEFKAAILKHSHKASSSPKSGSRSGLKERKSSGSSASSSKPSTAVSSNANSGPQSPRIDKLKPPPIRAGRSRSSSLQNARQPAGSKMMMSTKISSAAAGASSAITAQRSHSLQIASLKAQSEVQRKFLRDSSSQHAQKTQPNSILMQTSNSHNGVQEASQYPNNGQPDENQSKVIKKFERLSLDGKEMKVAKFAKENGASRESLHSYTSETQSQEDQELESEAEEYDENEEAVVKKVRFSGVPPMMKSENPRPTRKGWYIKPAVLLYPSIPPQGNVQSFKSKSAFSTQGEGTAFKHGHSLIKD